MPRHTKTKPSTTVRRTSVWFTIAEYEEMEQRRKKLGLRSRAALVRHALGFEPDKPTGKKK